MSDILYPKRLRCAACRKKLTSENVLVGRYCSFKCGGYALPAKSVEEAPRGCKRQVNGVWGYKNRFNSESEVPEKYRNDPASSIYECENCRKYHIGHNKPDVSHNPLKDDLSTVVFDEKALGETIRKYREALGVDKSVLAKSLKIPAIRITELERGDKDVSLKVLFLVVGALRMNLSLLAKAPYRR